MIIGSSNTALTQQAQTVKSGLIDYTDGGNMVVHAQNTLAGMYQRKADVTAKWKTVNIQDCEVTLTQNLLRQASFVRAVCAQRFRNCYALYYTSLCKHLPISAGHTSDW